MSASALPGSRDDWYRAGMMATTLPNPNRGQARARNRGHGKSYHNCTSRHGSRDRSLRLANGDGLPGGTAFVAERSRITPRGENMTTTTSRALRRLRVAAGGLVLIGRVGRPLSRGARGAAPAPRQAHRPIERIAADVQAAGETSARAARVGAERAAAAPQSLRVSRRGAAGPGRAPRQPIVAPTPRRPRRSSRRSRR